MKIKQAVVHFKKIICMKIMTEHEQATGALLWSGEYCSTVARGAEALRIYMKLDTPFCIITLLRILHFIQNKQWM